MSNLSADHFDGFFEELWGYAPFPWQRRLSDRVCAGDWPQFIDLPTASGKTACLDIAVFALVVQGTLPPAERTIGRRIFFVVNRRVIVDEAYERAQEIARYLLCAVRGKTDERFRCLRCETNATGDSAARTGKRKPPCWERPKLVAVAEALQQISGNAGSRTSPLDVAMLRGGIVRDNRWMRSITQPTIITSTIDQVGSRLLFRGYGVTPEAAPLHAALIAHDSTLLLDEAHISQPFVQTLDSLKKYRSEKWAEQPIRTPFHFVQMTATPGDTVGEVFRLDHDDETHPLLQKRHGTPKSISLVIAAKAKGRGRKAVAALATEVASKAIELQDEQHQNVAIVVNRIATARAIYELLPALLKKAKVDDYDLQLAIGRMRPLDRDELTRRIQKRVGKSRDESETANQPMFVVATQCLEVGADFDFDAMVSECASLDALRQRFGRLNRTGRDIEAKGCIVIRADQIQKEQKLAALDKKKEHDDPIYGNALARTWNWLQTVASNETADFGVNAMNATLAEATGITQMLAPRLDAPVMFPAYVDMWAQTNPIPVPSPDVSLFLHGPDRGEPDVNVCWRKDLTPENQNDWASIVSLCPPSSPECMPVPIGVVRQWLTEQETPADMDNERSDVLGGQVPDTNTRRHKALRPALVWRGVERSIILSKRSDVKPGDTVVLPVSFGGWDVFGHIPEQSPKDRAELAYRQSRGRVVLRLRPERLSDWPEDDSVESLREWLANADLSLRRAELRSVLRRAAELAPEWADHIADAMRLLAKKKFGLKEERYPDDTGVVLETRRRIETTSSWIPALDDGDDEPSRVFRKTRVPLDVHLVDVRTEVDRALRYLSVTVNTDVIGKAAELHDLGKADERFQALLLNGDRDDAWAQPRLWAKSAQMPSSQADRRAARIRSGLPAGFRHEMLSVQLAELLPETLPKNSDECDLVLHLIAAHHGRARPFAPVVIDDDPPDVTVEMPKLRVAIRSEDRRGHPPHRIDSGIAERFWKLTRCFGWWGLAYLEAILRLSDQQASAAEETDPNEKETVELHEVAK